MNQAEFRKLHAKCVAAFNAYVAEEETSLAMLATCPAEPPPLAESVHGAAPEAAESSAHLIYVATKRILSDARMGYAFAEVKTLPPRAVVPWEG